MIALGFALVGNPIAWINEYRLAFAGMQLGLLAHLVGLRGYAHLSWRRSIATGQDFKLIKLFLWISLGFDMAFFACLAASTTLSPLLGLCAFLVRAGVFLGLLIARTENDDHSLVPLAQSF